MDRVVDESHYVLSILRRTRDQILEEPDLFDATAQDRIDKAIALLEDAEEKVSA